MKPGRRSQQFIIVGLITTLSLFNSVSAFAHGGGGGGGGENEGSTTSANTSNVAPSGFISAPFGMPGAPQLTEQQDFGQAGTNSQQAEAQASAEEAKKGIKFLAITAGGIAVGYLTAGLSLGLQMFAAGAYAGTVSVASGDSAEATANSSAQDVVIGAIPAPPPVQAAISIAVTEARAAAPETAPSSSRGTGTGLYSSPASR